MLGKLILPAAWVIVSVYAIAVTALLALHASKQAEEESGRSGPELIYENIAREAE